MELGTQNSPVDAFQQAFDEGAPLKCGSRASGTAECRQLQS